MITMTESVLAPDATTALPGCRTTALAWRARGMLYVTVVAKATFTFASDAPMLRTEPEEILRAEVHHGSDLGLRVRGTMDVAPALARTDVLFTGSGHAPSGAPVFSLPVRMALFADQRPLLDKRLSVEPGRLAGFGPLVAIPHQAYQALERPIAEIPEGFDWSSFQAAPLDQQTELLRGDEWIILEGLHPSLPRFRTRLPGARGAARVHGLEAFGVPEGQSLDLRADTLRIDGDAQRCTVVWRCSFPVPSEAALAAVRVVAGVAVGGETLAWVKPRAVRQPAPAPGTLTIAPADVEALRARSTRPFQEKGASGAKPAAREQAIGRTFEISPEQVRAVMPASALPFCEGLSALAQPEPRSRAAPLEQKSTGTLDLSSIGVLAREAAPPPEPAPSAEPAPFWPGVAPPALLGPLATPAPAPAPPPVPALDTVPYFVPLAATTPAPAVPAAPEPRVPPLDPGDFPIERYAGLAAALAEQRTPREDLLGAEHLDEPAWSAIEKHWSEAIKRDGKQAAGKLRRTYDATYVTTVEGFRGPIMPAEYAQLALAGERGQADEVLDELRIQRAARMSVIRVWTKRLAADGRLRAEVSAARVALLAE